MQPGLVVAVLTLLWMVDMRHEPFRGSPGSRSRARCCESRHALTWVPHADSAPCCRLRRRLPGTAGTIGLAVRRCTRV